MKVSKPAHTPSLSAGWQYLFCGIITLAILFMILPVSPALATGVASVSLVLFSVAAVILIVFLGLKKTIPRLILGATLLAAVFGCVVPQVAFLRSAEQTGATLSFNPMTYLTFSGDTTISPTRVDTYKSTPGHTLQLATYSASAQRPRPTVLLLHGGGWRYGSHLETGEWPERLTSAGYTVVSIEYRLSSDDYHTWRDAPNDVRDALQYIRGHADELSIDPENISLLGQSAGGHLALLEAYRNQSVKSVISLYAPIDLTLDYTTSRDKSAELDFIGGPPSQFPDRYKALSPIHYVTSASPRTLLIQGKNDDLVATQNARLLATHLAGSGVDYSLVLLPLTGHSFENQHGGFATQIATQNVLQFLAD